MSDKTKNSLSISTIESSDTISQFMEKCNNNFSTIFSMGGGPAGVQGEQGAQGVPTKPKVPIHVWRKGIDFEYGGESSSIIEGEYEINDIYEDLGDEKYQLGHLIMLQNGHVYILEPKNENSFDLTPKFIMALQSYHPNSVIDGRSSYVHIAYADNDKGDGMITDQEYRNENNGVEVATFNVRRTASSNTLDISNKAYMGIYSDFEETSSDEAYRYTWLRIQGAQGEQGVQGIQGEQGTQGEAGQNGQDFTGQQFIVDIDGDMSTISLDIDRTRLYDSSDDYCKCTLHAYYGKDRTQINASNITINSTDEYLIDGNGDIVLKSNRNVHIGKIEKEQFGNDVTIKFTPDETFVFPQKSILFPIHISTVINDNGKTYEFNRDIVWTVKGIVSPFELEILPQYRTIKLSEEGYFPQILFVDVYKDMDGNRTLFNFNDSENQNFKLLYKFYDSNDWIEYTNDGVPTNVSSCIEFKVVRYIDSGDSNSYEEEVWDYEDVWVVSDGRDSHYYHADLGNTESMMVLTTGVKKSIDTTEYGTIYYAELKNESYSITFNPTFYDGTEPLVVKSVSIDSNNDNEYYINQTFVRELTGNTLTITRVPWGVDMIPMTIDVETTDGKKDHVPFSVYISSTVSDIYTLIPTVSVYNTSTGKDGEDKIGCVVYKNNSIIPNNELNLNALELKYVVYNNKNESNPIIPYTEPLVYGQDDDATKDNFTASDVAIEFILYHRGEEIVRSTVPLIKDGIDGEDGNNWQYIFCRLNEYPYPYRSDGGLNQNPASWYNDKTHTDPNEEYIVEDYNEIWFDDHQGVDKDHKYEYQSYRKWNKEEKYWGQYTSPTLYSNYSEDGRSGSGYSALLSNPVAVIPVGDNWSTDDSLNGYEHIQTDSTFVYLYDNISDISTEITINIIKDENESSDLFDHFIIEEENGIQKIIFKPIVEDENGEKKVFDFGSNTPFKLPIKISYNLNEDIDGDGKNDIFITTINWTLTPIKGLNDVEVFVDKRVVNTSNSSNHTIRVGYYLISTNNDKKFVGEHDSIDNTNSYQIKLTDNISNLKNIEAVPNWENASFNFAYDNGVNKNCYVVLVESDGETIVDYTNITSVNDGKSAIHLELTQDYIPIPCDNNGDIHEDFDGDISWQMILYNGDTVITDYENIDYNITIDNGSIESQISNSNGKITIPNENISKIITGDTNIECVAIYNGTAYRKTLFIDFDLSPYELDLNKNILTRDVNTGEITDNVIRLRVKYWDGENGWVYTSDGTTVLKDSSGFTAYFVSTGNESYDWVLDFQNIEQIKKSTHDEFRISYYKNGDNTNELTYETIGVVNSGLNGITKFKSTVFTRSQSKPAPPSGGDWQDPSPEGDIWEDGIPEGNDPIWSSSRWFSNENGFDSSWTAPVLMADTPDFEVIYSSLNKDTLNREDDPNNAPIPFYRDNDGGISSWLNEQNNQTYLKDKWSDDGDINSIWMATINKVNGNWGKWTITKIKGEKGADAVAPYCVSVDIVGYSKTKLDIDSSNWISSLDSIISSLQPKEKIYIKNKYTWSDETVTYGITVTLAGTQGVKGDDGKSRVLFYLGSYQDGTLIDTGSDHVGVVGTLSNERCDYYIDKQGNAWMRTGTKPTTIGYKSVNTGNNLEQEWVKSTKVGFLQAGAIHADMINTGSLAANDGFINSVQSIKITADQIEAGTITINMLEDGVIPDGLDEDDVENIISQTTISGNKIQTGSITANQIAANAITTDKIEAGAITSAKIDAGAITTDKIAANAITADKIDTTNLSAAVINTTPKSSNTIGRISILNNDIKVYSNVEEKIVLQITGDSFGDMSNIPSITSKSISMSSYSTDSGDGGIMHETLYRQQKIGTFTVPSTGYNYTIDLENNLSGNFIVTANAGFSGQTAAYFGYMDLYIVKKGATCPSYTGNCSAWFTPLPVDANKATTKTKSLATGSITNGSTPLSGGEYDLYVRHKFQKWLNYSTTTILCKATYASQTLNLTLTPDVDNIQESLTCIASNGLRFVKSATEYFELNDNCDLTYKCNSGKYVFTIDSDGLQMLCHGDRSKLTIDHTGIEISYEDNIGRHGLKLDSTGYYMYIADTKYKVSRDSSGYLKLT